MVKQWRLPTHFMTLSCAGFRWDESVSIIATLHRKRLFNKKIHNMDFFTWCSHLNLHSVFLARYFQCITEKFFKIIVLDGILRKDEISCYS